MRYSFFFQAEDGIRDLVRSRGLGEVYKGQVWNRDLNAYCYDQSEVESSQYQLPGLWFSMGEIQALLTMDALLESLQPGMLTSILSRCVLESECC